MSKLYDDVKKQGEQIDDLQKTVTNHTTRIETLETKAKATPPTQTQAMPSEVKVVLPDNIATKENIVGVVNKALHLMTDYVAEVVTKLYTENPSQKSPNPASEISDELIEKIAQKTADKAVNKRYEKLDATADTAMHRIYNLVNGAVWAAIPKWAYIIFAIAVLAAGGFGYGFFYLLNKNSKLENVEWLYRYERLWWEGKEQEDMLRREKIFAVGTQHEQDSIKNRTRQLEKSRHIEETFLYFNPTEK